jgi:DNA replication protein DnaC
MAENKIEFSCIGEKNFRRGYASSKGIHSYQDTPERANPRPPNPKVNLGLCDECRLIVADNWFKEIVSDKLWGASFSSFIQDKNPKAYKFAKSIKMDKGVSVLLWSEQWGNGKTHLAISILREYLNQYMLKYNLIDKEFIPKRRNPANMTSEAELIDKIRASFKVDDEGESESEIIDKYTEADVLLLDDVGKVTFSKNDFLNRIYFMVIDRMYNKKKGLIITSNKSPMDIGEHIGGACWSRLNEMCGMNRHEVGGNDYRIENIKEKK